LGRLKIFSGRQLCALLEQHGFVKVRQRGSHIVMQKREGETTVTIPIPDHAEIKIGTLLSIIRQSGLPRTVFEALTDVEEVLDSLAALGILAAYEAQGTRRWKIHPRSGVATRPSRCGFYILC